jgi:hypothetical protein
MTHGNLISFAVVVDQEGNLHTEVSEFPIEKIDDVFAEEDRAVIKKAIKETKRRFEGFHNDLEKELRAINSYML